jgi:hypothetical protein
VNDKAASLHNIASQPPEKAMRGYIFQRAADQKLEGEGEFWKPNTGGLYFAREREFA